MTALAPGSVIGILGGGQLGRMLALAAARLGYRIHIFDPDPDAPAAQVANRHIVAQYSDQDALLAFARGCALITYEFENVPVEAARLIETVTPVRPGSKALEAAQDRVSEKTFLSDAAIPTAPFRAVDSDSDIALALAEFGGSGVLKTRRMGYDGKGQRVFRNARTQDLDGAYAALGSVPLVLEGFIPFAREVSIIAARGVDGGFSGYDLAENVHRNGILHTSTVPASIPGRTALAALGAAKRVLDSLDYIGVIGIEFFVMESGDLIANEIAPRVHNSGHWTEAACSVSQFEQHIRAVTGLPLGDSRRHFDCIMENLIGGDIGRIPALCGEADTVVHHYGKAEARPGRKMGHFTRLSPLTS